MFLALPAGWLEEIAAGGMKTNWKRVLTAEDILVASDDEFHRLEDTKQYTCSVINAFLDMGVLMAEREAIQAYAMKNPYIMASAPEIVDERDALWYAEQEYRVTTPEDKEQLLQLLRNDELMQPLDA